jgi:hypothetical protein
MSAACSSPRSVKRHESHTKADCVAPLFPHERKICPTRLDEEAPSTSTRKQLAQPCQHGSIRWLQSRSCHLPAPDSNFVAKHDSLDGQILLPTTR